MTTTAPDASAESATSRHRSSDAHAVRAIIASARRPRRLPARASWICGAVSAMLWWACFFPLDWGPLAFLAPVPLLLLARIAERPRHLYRAVYLTWLVATAASLSWMAANLPMVGGWLALSIYLALYPVVFLALCRIGAARLKLPLVIAAPIFWTGLELLRGYLLTGFAWYYLAHTQWQWTTLIQISDLAGAYGVSFVVMTCAAAAAVWIPRNWIARLVGPASADGPIPFFSPGDSPRGRILAIGGALALLAVSLGYGAWRLSGANFKPGPRIALAQGNFPSSLHARANSAEVWHRHNRLTAMAVPYAPDFIIWPESAFRWPTFENPTDLSDAELTAIAAQSPYGALTADQWRRASEDVRGQLGDLATQAGSAMLLGTTAVAADAETGVHRYNTAVFSQPEIGVTGRYDKQHRVLFGEYIPFRETLPFLRALSPYTAGFSIDAGASTAVFDYREFSISPVICFEDTVPQLVRGMVAVAKEADKPIDVLVNISNDGWFHHSAEQPQHLATSLFRAVETRTPLARAANTGVSAVVDGNGRVVAPVAMLQGNKTAGRKPKEISLFDDSGEFRQDLEAVIVADVPLDPRGSLYVQYGDWFAGICAAACLFTLAWGLWRRKRPLAATVVG